MNTDTTCLSGSCTCKRLQTGGSYQAKLTLLPKREWLQHNEASEWSWTAFNKGGSLATGIGIASLL